MFEHTSPTTPLTSAVTIIPFESTIASRDSMISIRISFVVRCLMPTWRQVIPDSMPAESLFASSRDMATLTKEKQMGVERTKTSTRSTEKRRREGEGERSSCSCTILDQHQRHLHIPGFRTSLWCHCGQWSHRSLQSNRDRLRYWCTSHPCDARECSTIDWMARFR